MKKNVWLIVAPFALTLSGCGDSGPVEITDVREFNPQDDFEIPVLATDDASRFRYNPNGAAPSAAPAASGGGESGAELTWKTPDGWKELPSTSMRQPNLRFGENDEGECYVTRLSGGGGGMMQNVNRWRGQVGAEDLTEEEVEALPEKTLFGMPAKLVSVDGTFSGMGGAGKENYRLHGLILQAGGAMVTVKMTGPKELVAANEVKFDAFCASLDLRSGE